MKQEKDLFAVLEADHGEVADLLTQMKKAKDPGKRRALLATVRQELEIHASAEEQVIYPALRRVEITQDQANEAREEHEEIRVCLDTVTAVDPEDENWEAALESLEGTVRHHVDEEESEIFDSLRDCFDEEQLEHMKHRFLDAKRGLQQERAA
jgi:hemerythrin superfamily protein